MLDSASAPTATATGPLRMALRVDGGDASSARPCTVGVPVPRGVLGGAAAVALHDRQGCTIPCQGRALARWPDGSVRWLLLDFILSAGRPVQGECTLSFNAPAPRPDPSPCVEGSGDAVVVHTGPVAFTVERAAPFPLSRVARDGESVLQPRAARVVLTDARGREAVPRFRRLVVEEKGPVRATICLEGAFPGRASCRLVVRACFFSGTPLVRLRLTLHNPRRARHPGGLWDLGDRGSLFFRELALELPLAGGGPQEVWWRAEPQQSARCTPGPLEIYQDSSGGENWRSSNHVNRHGEVPCNFRGYRAGAGAEELRGLRARPVVALAGPHGTLTAAVPEFWQQFPKALEISQGRLRIGLFPNQWGDLHELQGGEQKTHIVWLHFGERGAAPGGVLDWVHDPPVVCPDPRWYASSGAAEYLAAEAPGERFDAYLAEATDPLDGLLARREVIDEYGWRHYGEVYADHEARRHKGDQPLVSHYNNQYDVVYGAMLQWWRTGDRRWRDLFEPLARHVIDIDIYHTDRDKAAYNGGLFWLTDHYKDAATCTHRTYSRANCRRGDRSYGGGPGSSHNFTTGLLHYYYQTGDPQARDAVLSLADWVVFMDDGRRNVLGLVDDGPTGHASTTADSDYHGPGRGPGLSVNALLDGWLLCGRREYLAKAEELIRRCIHPHEDVAARDLLDVEPRWSYTVFLSVLARYLRVKAEAGELDFGYAYAQASLVHYARWMVENEVPYYDTPEKLEFPTEAWAAQEFRKANVLRLAASHADEPLRGRFLGRGRELADRAWDDLLRFTTRTAARAVAILLTEGTRDLYFRQHEPTPAPRPGRAFDFGAPEVFVPQKRRVLRRMRSARGMMATLLRLASPARWLRRLGGDWGDQVTAVRN
jgi:hypothetical protein